MGACWPVVAVTRRSGSGMSNGAAIAQRSTGILPWCMISLSCQMAAACSVGVKMAPCGCGTWSAGSVHV